MTEAHEQQHERLEREAADLERKSEHLGDDIAHTRRAWEEQKTDDSVPGAQSPEGGLPPEANYTTSGDNPPDDRGEEPWPDE